MSMKGIFKVKDRMGINCDILQELYSEIWSIELTNGIGSLTGLLVNQCQGC